jgi:hypothetical protein
LTTKFSAINFLIELKDFKFLFRRVSGKLNVWKNLLRSLYDPARSLRHNLANLRLQYAFAWKPLVADLQDVIKGLRTFEKRYNALVAAFNKSIRRRASLPVTIAPWQVTYDRPWDSISHQSFFMKYRYEKPPLWRMTVKYRFKVPLLRSTATWSLGVLDSLGVNPNPAILWNAIPFSFVLDWFVGVGDWLDSFGQENISIPVEVEELVYSVKGTRRYEAVSGISVGASTQLTLLTADQSAYQRWVERFPVQYHPLNVHLPSFWQAVNGAALATVLTSKH